MGGGPYHLIDIVREYLNKAVMVSFPTYFLTMYRHDDGPTYGQVVGRPCYGVVTTS